MQNPTLHDEVDLDLDVQIAATGPVSSVLMSSTDDGCDTVKTGDC
ncbi:FxLD family lanthipeptide [Catellatospora methionotrophica]